MPDRRPLETREDPGAGPMLEVPVEDGRAWTRATLPPDCWRVMLPERAAAELLSVHEELRRSPLPLFMLDPHDYRLEACGQVMREVEALARHGPMFAVLDRLPVDGLSPEESTALYWLVASLMSRPVAQKLNGQMLFDVTDTGAEMAPGSGVRPTVTNVDLRFHNDNSYNETPPDFVCLLCLHPARQGGRSQLVSVYAVHETLRREYRALLPRFYRPFWYDRHAEHEAHERRIYRAPIFEYDGQHLRSRLAIAEIEAGYELADQLMDEETKSALDALREVFERPELRVELDFEPGQVQFLNNRMTGHARTRFADYPEAHRKRHLVRLWLRDRGPRNYRGGALREHAA